jgi:DNA repair exonuclease SbcCD nuclease subunit
VKILFSADLHIKLGQKNVPVEWAKNRYRLLFKDFQELSSQADLTILGGDIFDKLPNIEELELYFELVQSINSDCIIYAGNHEALKKNTTFFTSLKDVTNKLNWQVAIIDDFTTYKGIDFIPYNKLKEPWPTTLTSKILCTHVRGEIPPHVKPEVDLSLFDKWQVVLAGDLHSYSNSQLNILYPGSPVTTSFHRSNVDTGVILFDTDVLQHEWIKLDLPQLIRKTIQAGEPMPPTDYDHTIYEVEGDMSSLSGLENTELLDKKVVKRSSDTALILDPKMSLAEEVEEYLRYILELPDNTVHDVLKELNDYKE